MRSCAACRRELPPEAKFCGYCGFKSKPLAGEQSPILLTKVKKAGRTPAHGARAVDHDEPVVLQTRKLVPASELPPPPTSPGVPKTVPALPPDDDQPERLLPKQHPTPRAQRFPMLVEVGYNSAHNFYTGLVENLSRGGLFIATHELLPLGEVLEVNFIVPGLAEPCKALCQVCWHREYNPDEPDFAPGMGCKFGPLEPEVRTAIEAFIAHRDPIFFEP